jgi:urease accessory protein
MDGIDQRVETCIMHGVVPIANRSPDVQTISRSNKFEQEHRSGWHAQLQLEYSAADGATRITRREHSGPLAIQKSLYPEGRAVCHSLILHPPSGIVGGDRLDIDIGVNRAAHALITMPGATRWYRSAGATSNQRVQIVLGRDAMLEWLPPETIVYNGAIAQMQTDVTLDAGARYLGWEIMCLGRTAAGEQFLNGSLRQHSEIRIGDELIWDERCRLAGDAQLLRSVVGLGGAPVTATLLAAGLKIPKEILSRCRAHAVDGAARVGVSAIDALFVARYIGASSEQARAYFVSLWRELRPLLAGRAAVTPRIWNT